MQGLINSFRRAARWAIGAAAAAVLVMSLSSCGTSEIGYLRRMSGLDIESDSVKLFCDTHGGFLGDGTSAAVIDYGMQPPEGWLPLPLPSELHEAVYGSENRESSVSFEQGIPAMPQIDGGCYLFIDRYDGPDSELSLLNRASLNFTIAVYDSSSGLIYFYSVDT